ACQRHGIGRRAQICLLRVRPGYGLGWTFQAVPFQCSTRVWPVVVGDVAEAPTAQAREGDRAATAVSQLKAVLPGPPGVGPGTCTPEGPFQGSGKGWLVDGAPP